MNCQRHAAGSSYPQPTRSSASSCKVCHLLLAFHFLRYEFSVAAQDSRLGNDQRHVSSKSVGSANGKIDRQNLACEPQRQEQHSHFLCGNRTINNPRIYRQKFTISHIHLHLSFPVEVHSQNQGPIWTSRCLARQKTQGVRTRYPVLQEFSGEKR